MRRASQRDANHAEVVKALRNESAKVLDLSLVGGGCPDIAVFRGGIWTFLEIKDGKKPPSARKLNALQQKWHDEFQGAAHVVTSPEEAVNLILGRSQGVL